VRVYRDPTQRLNGSGKDSLEQTPKQRSIKDTREFRQRMENGRSNTDSMVLIEGVSVPPEFNTGLWVSELREGMLVEVRWGSRFRQSTVEWRRNHHHGSTQQF
jgi:hypothetical protein